MDILIVESAAKARTLQRYLGDGWKVVATGGHVETLPNNREAHGKDGSKAYWANRPGELPSPPWVWTDRGEAALEKILDEAGDDPTFWVATDPDREGEFIAWCLDRLLEDHGPTHRVSFEEITEEAVREALENPRPVDERMVQSALVRKFVDRLVGFRTSKLARRVVPGRSASMGRVQTPTLGFVVERELEREAHVPIPYFEVRALAEGVELQVRFHERDDPEAWRDEAEKVIPSRTFNGELAEAAVEALEEAGQVELTDVTRSTRRRKPRAPFSTDALLQAGGSRFGWSPRKTSALASMLYEAGHITYIRTDSTRLAASAVRTARGVISEAFGEDRLGPEASANVATGPVQDAHEAIRPTRPEVDEAPLDDADARTLYRLIRARTLASQMAPSVRSVVSVEADCEGYHRPLRGSVSWRTFDGWEAAYEEFLGQTDTEPPEIPLEEGAEWALDPATEERENPLLIEDETRPPPRYRPHSLIGAMKDAGIGRPSTYSRTVEKLQERDYLETEDGALAPTEQGRAVWLRAAPLYTRVEEDDGEGDKGEGAPGVLGGEEHATSDLFSTEFTALMEERLDRIARGDLPAPSTWEEWRDRIRDLHNAAREQLKSGRSTSRQQTMLRRLLENVPDPAPAELEALELPDPNDDLSELTYEEAGELTRTIREAGVKPTPTERQIDYLARLAEELGLDDEELEEVTGLGSLDQVRTSDQASAAIDELRALHDEQRPASAKQRRYIESLLEETGLSEEEATALVDAESLDDLTGGAEGTASALIDQLKERAGESSERQ